MRHSKGYFRCCDFSDLTGINTLSTTSIMTPTTAALIPTTASTSSMV